MAWLRVIPFVAGTLLTSVVSADIPDFFKDTMQKKFSSLTIETVSETPSGLIEVGFKERTDLIYATADAKYFVPGDLFEVTDSGYANLSKLTRDKRKQSLLDALNPDKMIVFKALGVEKEVLTVFTDIDCGYCQKFHLEVPQLNKAGITIRYMAFPRAGVGSSAYTKYVSSYCSDTPKETLTKAKAREEIQTALCENPVSEQYLTGQRLGVNSTPNLFTSSGQLIKGYMPAPALIKKLNL